MSFEQWLNAGSPPSLWLAGFAVVVAAVAHAVMRSWIRRQERRLDAAAASASAGARVRWWLSRSVRDSLPPFALLLWIHAVTLVLYILVLSLAREQAPRILIGLSWIYGLGLTGALFWLLSRIGVILEALLISVARQAETAWDGVMLPLAGKAIRRLLPILAFALALSMLTLSPALEEVARKATVLLAIGVIAWLLFQAVDAAATLVLRRYRIDVRDNLQARAIHTQVAVLKRVAGTVIVVFGVASALTTFESARQFGTSILASAGIAGIVVGLAAQRSLATLLAGFQIALTQPIRVDDVVIVENEWGRVEDITLTYVVVRIWDQRRLVVPITYFIEQPFQNWTRSSSELLAPVFLHVDYATPIDALREELTRILKTSPHWDGRVNVLQVTDAKEHALEVRALASATDASVAWNLRCEVRERLVDYLQRERPASLPRIRALVASDARELSRPPMRNA